MCKLRAIEPPLDEQEDKEVDEERVHHTYSEYNGVWVFKSGLKDGWI